MMERLLICMCCLLACYFHCSTAIGGSQNIFRRPPPQYEDSGFYDYYISRGSSANLSLLENNGDCVPPRLPPGINATCQSLQNQNQTFALQDNPFLSSLLDSLDVASYCQCDNVTAEPPMVCGSLCLGDNVLSEDRILDPQSGLTCGDVRIMAPHVDTVQFCPILSILAPLCCIGNFSQQSLQEEDSCDLCNHNQSQRPFLLPLSPRHSQKWADNMLCPSLKSFYAQQEQSNNNTCSSYDIALREDWSLRYFSHSTSMWALPVNLSSLCCNSSTSALSRPPFCPSGTHLQPNSPVLADLTCGQLEHLLPHLAHEETYDSLSTYSSGCCRPPQPPQDDVTRPPGSTVRRVTTSLILASRTPGPTDADLDHLQEAFGSLVSEIVDEPSDPTTVTLRLRRGSSGNATIPKWDPASPRIDRFQTASCPSYWIEAASVCAQVEASYDLFVSITDQVASQDYPGRTENAINDGRLYRELRLADPDTTLAVLGTADAAYQQRFNNSSGDMEDGDDQDKEERHMVFLLGVTVGIAVALIGWAIGRTMAAARRRKNTAVQPYPIDDAGHEKQPLNRLEEDDAAGIHVDATSPETPRPMERRDGSTSRIDSSSSRERPDPNLMKEECKTPIDPEPTPATSHKRSAGRGERREPRVGSEQHSIPQNATPSEPPAIQDCPRDIFFDPDQLVYDGSSPSPHRANVSKALFQADDDEVIERRSLAQTVLMERMVELELLERMKDCSSVVDSSSSSIAVSENEGSANHNESDANYHHPRESERNREPDPMKGDRRIAGAPTPQSSVEDSQESIVLL